MALSGKGKDLMREIEIDKDKGRDKEIKMMTKSQVFPKGRLEVQIG